MTAHSFLSSCDILPQEELSKRGKSTQNITIGIPAETDECEYRISLTPQAVEILTAQGVRVLKEKNAGKKAKYSDEEYSEAGARICESKIEVFKCDVLLKIGAITEAELPLVRERQTILSYVPTTQLSRTVILELIRKKATAIGYEFVCDEQGNFPILRSLNEIVGSLSIIAAAECLSDAGTGKGVLLGGVTGVSPAEVMILGANTAGEFAARAALGLGASVKFFDSQVQRLAEMQHTLSQRLFTSTYHEMVFRKALTSADVVIGAIQLESEDDFVVSEEMVRCMKPGTVIIDLCMDGGGCFATSRATSLENPTFVKHSILHYCVPNIASRAARTASIALSNILLPMVQDIATSGNINTFLKQDYAARQGVYLYNGIASNAAIANHLGLPHKSIDLLSAMF